MGDSLRSTPVTNVAYLTLNGNFGNNNNDAQLTFRPLNKDLAPVSGYYYSLATNQTTDPSLRINRWSSTGVLLDHGYLYDSRYNKPPSSRTVVAGGYGITNTLYSLDNGFSWILSESGSAEQSECTSIAFNGSLWVAGGLGKLLYSGDGIIWTPSPNAESLIVDANGNGSVFGLAANGSLWVAGCGDSSNNNNLLYSYDGIYWRSSATSPALLGNCNAIAWNGSLWVATGAASSGSPILYSYDGIIWYSSVYTGTPFSQGLSIAWNGSRWIVGGQNDISGNTIASSSDGINWTYDTFPLEYVRTIAYNAGFWLIGGLSATDSLFFSEDGYTWTPVPDSKTLLNDCNAIIWTGTVWLAGGQGTNTIIRSFDGLNWLSANNAPLLSSGCLALAVNNVLPNAPLNTIQPPSLLLGGVPEIAGIVGIAYSSDGITWESIRSSLDLSGATCNALLWNGSLWIGGFTNTSNTIGYSYDGLTWNTSSNGSLYLLDGCVTLATDGDIILAGGSDPNRMIYSSNGRDWATIPSADSLFNNNSCLTIGYNGTQWVAGSDSSNNRLIYSSDPSGTWLASASGNALFPSSCYSVAWNGAIWVAVGDTIADSSDGINWTQAATIPIDIYWRTVAYNGSLWVAGGIGATPIAYSYDGSIWRAATVANSIARCYSVTWTGSLWIAAGGDSSGNATSAAYSYNGITWFASPNSNEIMSIGYAVAAKRLNPNVGVYLPPPVLNPVAATQQGQIVYSTGLNNLYVSSIMSIDDGLGEVQIQGDISANTIHTPTLYVTSNIIANDLSLNTIQVITMTGSNIIASDLSVNTIEAITLTGSNISVEDISVSTVNVWTDLSASTIHVYDLTTSNILANTISVDTLTVFTNIFANDMSLNKIDVNTIISAYIDTQDILTNGMTATIIYVTDISASNTISVNTLNVDTINSVNILTADITADRMSVIENLSASTIYVNDLSANAISANTITTNTMTVNNDLFATTIYVTDISASDTISVNTLNVDTINSVNILTADITADRMSVIEDLSASTIYVNDIYGTVVNADTLYANVFEPLSISTEYLLANRISATDISAGNLDAENLYVSGIIAPTITAETLNAGIILATGSSLPIGTLVNETAIIITDDRTTIQNVDLSGTVYIGQGSGYGQLVLESFGTEDNPGANIYPNTYDSSGVLNLGANYDSTGIILRPGETQISNAYIVESGLLIDNGTIGKPTSNPNAIVIGGTRTMVQNADLSGVVYIGDGQEFGNLLLRGGTAANPNCEIFPNTDDASGQLILGPNASDYGIVLTSTETRIVNTGLLIDNGTIGKTTSNPNAIVIGDTRTMIQNADLSGDVFIGDGQILGNLLLRGGTAAYPTCDIFPYATDSSGVLILRGNATSVAGITITPAETVINNMRIATSGLLIDNGTIGKPNTNPNAIVIGDTRTMVQNADLSGVVYIGDGQEFGNLSLRGGTAASPNCEIFPNTEDGSGQLVLGPNPFNYGIVIRPTETRIANTGLLIDTGTIGKTGGNNPNAIIIGDERTMIQGADLSGIVKFGQGIGELLVHVQNTADYPIADIYPNAYDGSGEIRLFANINTLGINIKSTETLINNARIATSGLLIDNGTIGKPNTNPNAIVIGDTRTMVQNADLSGTVLIGNLTSGALQLTGSSSGSTIRPTVASAGRLTIGSSIANPNGIVISDTSGMIIQNRGDLSGTLLIGNPSRGLRITGGDISGVAIPTGFATMRPSVSVSGCLVLGSSTLNPDAITITDTSTSIKNLSMPYTNVGTFSGGGSCTLQGPGQYIFQQSTPPDGDIAIDTFITIPGRYILYNASIYNVANSILFDFYLADGLSFRLSNTSSPIRGGYCYTFDIITGLPLGGSGSYLRMVNRLENQTF